MKLGLVTYLMGKDLGLEELIAMCDKTGIEGLELRSTHAHGVETTLTADERAKVREQFTKAKVELCCLGSACEYDSPDAAVVKKNIADTKAFVDLAQDVGAEAVKVRPNHLHDDIPAEDTLKQIAKALRECGDYAEGKGIELWMEIHGRGTNEVPHCATIMQECDHAAVGLTWNCNGSDIVDGSVRENWLLVSEWVRCLHIHDLYEDSYPYMELFALCKETGFDGWANQEMAGSSDEERVLHYYRALFDFMVRDA